MKWATLLLTVLLVTNFQPGNQQNPDAPVDPQIHRAGLLFQQTDYGLQIVEETVVVQIPFSLSPLRSSVDFIEKFMASMCVRIDRLMMRFKDTHDKEPDFPGKEETTSLFLDVIARMGDNVANHLDFRKSEFMSLAQNALALTLGIRSPPSAWYSRPGLKMHQMNVGDVVSPSVHHHSKRGALALAGTMASLMPLDQLWPLVSDQPVIPTLSGWLKKLSGWFTRDSGSGPQEKELEREVHDVFNSMKEPPQRPPLNSSDPTIGQLSDHLLSGRGESFSPVMQVAERTSPNNYMDDFRVIHKVDKALLDQSRLAGASRSFTINSLRLLSEVDETRMLIDRVFDQEEEVVNSYSTLLEDMDRGASIQQSRALLRAWKQISTRLDRELILGSAREQLSRLIPRMYLGSSAHGSEFEIHLLIERWDPRLKYDLFRSQVVPFTTNLGTMQVSVPETAQIVSRGVGAVYRFDWSRLSDCSLFEGTYFCRPSVIEADSRGRCVSAITGGHFKDEEILEKCPLSLADEGLRLVRLSDDKIYFDVPRMTATFKCEASDSIRVEGRGMIFLNPGCSLRLGPYSFTNERGTKYSTNGQIISMQRQIVFPETPSEGGMTGIYRWLGISSGAVHSHWAHHLYAMAAINALCLMINLIVTYAMRRTIRQSRTERPEQPLSSSSSESEEEDTGRKKGVSLKVRYDKSSSSRAKITTTRRSKRPRARRREEDRRDVLSTPVVVRKTVSPRELEEGCPEEYKPSAPVYQAPRSPVYFS